MSTMSPTPAPGVVLSLRELPLPRLGLAMFLTSVSATLFSLLIFRLLSFFIMPSIFFSLLLLGFPVGAALAAHKIVTGTRTFRNLLWALQAVMVLSLFATFLCQHVGFLCARILHGVDTNTLLLQMLGFALIYLPFFIVYGAAEYSGYLAGTAAFAQRTRAAFGLFLFGSAAAYLLAGMFQRSLGVPRLLVSAMAAVALARLLLASRGRWRNGLELVLLAGVIAWPGFDPLFMRFFKASHQVDASAPQSPDNSLRSELIYSGWGRYSYLEIVKYIETRTGFPQITAFYNDVNLWTFF